MLPPNYLQFLRARPSYLRTTYDFRRVRVTWEHSGRPSAFAYWRECKARRAKCEEKDLPNLETGSWSDTLTSFLWVEGDYRFIAQVHPDDDYPTWDAFDLGTLDDKEPRGDPRQYWKQGHYARFPGEPPSSREFNYGHFDYSYDAERAGFSRLGYSRRDADLLARGTFDKRRERLERYARGDLGWVGIVTTVFALADEDHEHPLGGDSLWGIESDYETDYILERAFDCAQEVIRGLSSSRVQPTT